jgi:uncharacterized protein YjiS (DUF1127 family)
MSNSPAIRTTRALGAGPAAMTTLAETGRRGWSRLYSCVAECYRRRRARDELARFSPRMLQDIGITPADRERECIKPFWQP